MMPTKIEWTDESWSPITGCSLESPGCTNCYAMRLAGTRLKNHSSRAGLTIETKTGPVWTGEVRFNEQWLDQPLRWARPRMIFVCPHADLFHPSVPREWIDSIFAQIALCPHHTFQVLTKRSDRMRRYMNDPATPARIYELACDIVVGGERGIVLIAPGLDAEKAPPGRRVQLGQWPLPNVWAGVSVEDQERAQARVPDLLATSAAMRWLSLEPLLGPVNLRSISTFRFRGAEVLNGLSGQTSGMFGEPAGRLPGLDWAVCGGESGPRARDFDPAWGVDLLEQCEEEGVPFFFKQLGAKRDPKRYKAFDTWPAGWRVRQWPEQLAA